MNIVRRLVHALILVMMLLVGATAAIVIVSQTSWFKNWLRAYIVRQSGQYLNGVVSIDRLGGNVWFGLELENVGVSMDGGEVVAVKDLELDYNVFQMIARGLSVDSIRLNKPVVHVRREGDTWSISRLIKKQEQEADRSGPDRSIAIDELNITDGAVFLDTSAGPVGTSGVSGASTTPALRLPKRFEHLDAKLAFHYEPVRYSIDITQVTFRGSDPDIALNALSGGVSVRNDTLYVEKLALRTAESSLSIDGAVQQYLTTPIVNIHVSSDKMSLPEMARLAPVLSGIQLQPTFTLALDGPFNRLNVDMDVRSSAGQMAGTVVADVEAPDQSAKGVVSVRNLNLEPIVNDPQYKSDITGKANIDLHAASFADVSSLGGEVLVDAPHVAAAGLTVDHVKGRARVDGRRVAIEGSASAYGASATTAGRVTLPAGKSDQATFDLRGQARHLDLRRLPRQLGAPPAATDINGEYHVAGSGSDQIHGDLRFAPSAAASAAIEGGSTAAFAKDRAQITYMADATIGGLDLQQLGEQFRIDPLANGRFKSAINGHIAASGRIATPTRQDDSKSGLDVAASGTLHDSSIMGGRIPELTFDAAIQQDTARVKARGSFADFNPAVISGKSALEGAVGGSVDVDGAITNLSAGVTPDSVEGSGKITLDRSRVGELDITRATLDGDYRRSTADLRTFDVIGRDLNVQASGRLALNETDQSNLTVHADSASLDQIGKIVNQPLSGIGQADFSVTGNKHELQASGKLTGGNVKYGANGALSISSDFTAKLPDLDAQRASVSAQTKGTFVTVAGQNINDVTATIDYGNQQVTFDLTARQPQRTLAGAGSLLMHPDHQEVHVQRLALTAQGMTWTTVPGSNATVQYGNAAVKVSDFALVSGDQQIIAQGGFGQPGDVLQITANNVDVGAVDAILLRPPQLSGRLNASATVAGTRDALRVDGQFKIEKGGFRKFQYDSFGGSATYTGNAVQLDTRLLQNPTTWIDVKGHAPMALLRGAGSTSTEPIDLLIDSTPIDAGLVQGFTTSLTNVTGLLEAHVHVVGSAADPQPTGAVTIQNAAFTLEPNGVAYTDLDGKIDLQPDRVHIEEIRVLDNHSQPLSLSGDMAIHELEVGGLSIAAKASDFKIIDNELGNVRINTDLQITGDLNAPRIEGDLGVTTGQINLDPILNLLGPSPYATEQIDYNAADRAAAGAAAQQPPAASGLPTMNALMEAVTIDVRLTVPNDLVIKADDLRALESPISLGALNLTLGGNLYVGRTAYDKTRIWGTVNTVRGSYDFQGRKFTILRDGTVRFEGLDELDPDLNVRTERVIQGVTTNVTINGRLKQPEIVLSSVPPLEPADILALIVFNQPINQLGQGQQIDLAQRAESLATGAIAGQLANSIGKALGVDVFEISGASETGLGAELTIGQQVSQNLFVKLEQGLGNQGQTNFILEYQLTDWLRLQTNVLQNVSTQPQLFQRAQGSGADLLFFFSY